MNLICYFFGHKWKDTSSFIELDIKGKQTKFYIQEKTCDRCEAFERSRIIRLGESEIKYTDKEREQKT